MQTDRNLHVGLLNHASAPACSYHYVDGPTARRSPVLVPQSRFGWHITCEAALRG